jgi:hypothetical protein
MTVGELRKALEGLPASNRLQVYSYGTERTVTKVEVLPSGLKTTVLVLLTKEGRS